MLLKPLERAGYGRRAETLDPEHHAFVFEEIQSDVAAIEAYIKAANPVRARTPPVRARPCRSIWRGSKVLIEPDAGLCVGYDRQ
ncbi:hypothetical protein ATO13_03735 [Stappia sp. 22II-S9-Z10]|nr:hypothetical protein ATO13_03735 [Stappia sp. 22II-S9-Z10]